MAQYTLRLPSEGASFTFEAADVGSAAAEVGRRLAKGPGLADRVADWTLHAPDGGRSDDPRTIISGSGDIVNLMASRTWAMRACLIRSVALQTVTGGIPREPGVLLLESVIVTPAGSRLKRALGVISGTLAEGLLAASSWCQRVRPVSAFLYGLRGWTGEGANWNEVAEIIYADNGMIPMNIRRELTRRAALAAGRPSRIRTGGK